MIASFPHFLSAIIVLSIISAPPLRPRTEAILEGTYNPIEDTGWKIIQDGGAVGTDHVISKASGYSTNTVVIHSIMHSLMLLTSPTDKS